MRIERIPGHRRGGNRYDIFPAMVKLLCETRSGPVTIAPVRPGGSSGYYLKDKTYTTEGEPVAEFVSKSCHRRLSGAVADRKLLNVELF